MEPNTSTENLSFFERLAMAMKLIFDAAFAQRVVAGEKALSAQTAAAAAPPPPPERVHASALLLLNALQREGRLIDFIQQDVSGFSDEEIGAAARVVHTGCQKVVRQYFDLEPATREAEGATLTLPKGFDAQRFRLTGRVEGQPPFRGTVKHHGWFAKETRLPAWADTIDPRVLAPAEVELP